MTNEKDTFDAIAEAKLLLRETRAASLSTLAPPDGHPFASLVNVASAPDGSLLLLLSRLAAHRRHIEADPRVSLLLYSASNKPSGGDPLTKARLTLVGRGELLSDVQERHAARARFLARHPKSALYVDFADFAFFRVEIDAAHLNGGFGRAANLRPEQLATGLEGAQSLLAQEAQLMTEIAESEPGIANRLAETQGHAGDESADQWRLVGFDPEGLDIGNEEEILRLPFGKRIVTADELRQSVAALLNT